MNEVMEARIFASQTVGGESFLSDGMLNASGLSDNAFSSSNKPQPNILKKRDNSYHGPIKNLPFSPSRFLNNSKNRMTNASSCKSGGLQDEALCISTTEDSGIEISSCDIDQKFPNAITSTPKLKKQQSILTMEHSFEVSRLGETCIFSGPDSLFEEKTTGTTPDRVVFRSPLIRRFINESGPRTPTPFKFRFGKNSFTKTVETNDRVFAEPSYTRFSKKRFKCRSPARENCPYKRKARKALNMDGSCHGAGEKSCPTTQSAELYRPYMYRNQFCGNSLSGWKNGSFYTRYLDGSVMNYSNLIDGSYEETDCHAAGSSALLSDDCASKRSSQHPPPSSSSLIAEGKYLSDMNDKLVRVACGHSEDQKAMTLAAKRYLRSIQVTHTNDSKSLKPSNQRYFHCILR